MLTFRFDDISCNVSIHKLNAMVNFILEGFPGCQIWLCISPLYHEMFGKENVFPLELMPLSDHREFYKVDYCGIPDIEQEGVVLANHGLVHVDHRLLSKEAQELSILTCASLTRSRIFVPPFNHYNMITEQICKEHNIELIKYEDGWLNLKYNKFTRTKNKWYLHSYEFTIESFKELFL